MRDFTAFHWGFYELFIGFTQFNLQSPIQREFEGFTLKWGAAHTKIEIKVLDCICVSPNLLGLRQIFFNNHS